MPRGIPKSGVNKGWMKKNNIPWNKNTKGIMKSNSGSFKVGDFKDEKHMFWKGDAAGYVAKHQWIRRKYGKASRCVHCECKDAKRYEWANISKEYMRDIDDWLELCKSCHIIYDRSSLKAWKTRRAKT